MSKTILIIIGIICLIVVILLIYSMTKQFISNMTWKKALILLAILIVVLGVVAYLLFGSKGNDSIFSDNVEGATSGNAEAQASVNEDSKDSELGFTQDEALEGNTPGDTTVYVRINAGRISIGSREFEDSQSAVKAVQSLGQDSEKICIVDDYALASTYNGIKDALDELGIKYTEQSVE